MQKQIYVIGDVHGCYKTLKVLIEKLPENAEICFVGDLCDRGKNSKEVIEFVKSGNYACVLGNHEMFFINAVENLFGSLGMNQDTSFWLTRCGGQETIDSYNINGVFDKKTLMEHLNWLKTLPLYKEYRDIESEDGRYLVVTHSHVYNKWKFRNYKEGTKEHEKFANTVLFSRFKNFDNPNIFNVFGHTPTPNPIVEKHKASIDLGCAYSKDTSLEPRLCALEFPSMRVITQNSVEV